MKSSDLKVATHADIANIRYCVFCQPGGVPHTLAVCANWLNVHAGIMYSSDFRRHANQNCMASIFYELASDRVYEVHIMKRTYKSCQCLLISTLVRYFV